MSVDENNNSSDRWIFLPISFLLICWYVFVMLFVMIYFILTVIVLCYRDHLGRIVLHEYLNYFMSVILFVDIIVALNTGFIRKGKIILQRKLAMKGYLTSLYFIVDILSFSVSLCQIFLRNYFDSNEIWLNFLIFVKVIKVARLDVHIKKYVIRAQYTIFYEILKNLILLSLVCHVIGSFFYYLDLRLIDLNWYSTEKLWIYNSSCYHNIVNQSFYVKYVYSFNFAVVTLSGTAYGDLVPLNPVETGYVIGCLVVPILAYAYIFSSIYSVIYERRTKSIKIKKYKFLARQYFQTIGVRFKLRNKLMSYLEFVFKNRHITDNSFMKNFSPSAKKIYQYNISSYKFNYSIFEPLGHFNSPIFMDKLIPLIQEQSYSQRCHIMLREVNKLCYINRGRIAQYIDAKQKYFQFKKKKNFIGTFQFYTGALQTNIKTQSYSFIIIQTINAKQFRQLILNHFVHLIEPMSMLKDELLIYEQLSALGNFQNCFFCESVTHRMINCTNLPPKFFHFDVISISKYYNFRKEFPRRKRIKMKRIIANKRQQKQQEQQLQKISTGRHDRFTQANLPFLNNHLGQDVFQVVHNWSLYYLGGNI